MKTLLSLTVSVLVSVFSLSAHASYFQENCRNSDATVGTASGHSENFIFVTQKVSDGKNFTTQKVELDLKDLSIAYENETTLEQSSGSTCNQYDKYGISYWKSVTAKKVTISLKDGSSFPANTLGLSTDKKTISTYLVCEVNGNAMIPCNP